MILSFLVVVAFLGRDRGPVLVIQSAALYDAALVVCPSVCDSSPEDFPVLATLESGETIDQLLVTFGLSGQSRLEIVSALSEYVEVRRLRPGLEVTGYFSEGLPAHLQVLVPRKGNVLLEIVNDEWSGQWRPFTETVREHEVAGVIEGSLVGALSEAGAPIDVAYRMADVLKWDVDFNRDLRSGDRFEVVYEDYLSGRGSGSHRLGGRDRILEPGTAVGGLSFRGWLLRCRGASSAEDVLTVAVTLLSGHLAFQQSKVPSRAQDL